MSSGLIKLDNHGSDQVGIENLVIFHLHACKKSSSVSKGLLFP